MGKVSYLHQLSDYGKISAQNFGVPLSSTSHILTIVEKGLVNSNQ